MNYLQLLNVFASKWGLPTVSSVQASDPQTRQLAALVTETVEYLRDQPLQVLRQRVNWTAVVGTNQGAVDTLWAVPQAPLVGTYAYNSLIRCTLWDTTSRRPLIGPVTDADWQLLQANPAPGPSFFYRIDGGNLLVWPAMTTAVQLSAIVFRKELVYDLIIPGYKELPTLDSDTFLVEDSLMRTELEWRWLRQKNEPWSAAYEMAQQYLSKQLDKDGSMPTFSLTPGRPVVRPGIWVPAGSWNV